MNYLFLPLFFITPALTAMGSPDEASSQSVALWREAALELGRQQSTRLQEEISTLTATKAENDLAKIIKETDLTKLDTEYKKSRLTLVETIAQLTVRKSTLEETIRKKIAAKQEFERRLDRTLQMQEPEDDGELISAPPEYRESTVASSSSQNEPYAITTALKGFPKTIWDTIPGAIQLKMHDLFYSKE